MKKIASQIHNVVSQVLKYGFQIRNNNSVAFNNVLKHIKNNDLESFRKVLQTSFTTAEKNRILLEVVEHSHSKMLHEALKVCDPGHRKCRALGAAVLQGDLKMVGQLAQRSHPNIRQVAAESAIVKVAEMNASENRLHCLTEILKWVNPRANKSRLLQLALLQIWQSSYRDKILDILWRQSNLSDVANSDGYLCTGMLYTLAKNNDTDMLDRLWMFARPKSRNTALLGAVAGGWIPLVHELVKRLEKIDRTQALVESILTKQEESFNIFLPLSNHQKALSVVRKTIDYHNKHWKQNPNILQLSLHNYSLFQKLEDHCNTVRQRHDLIQAIEKTKNIPIASPPKRRM